MALDRQQKLQAVAGASCRKWRPGVVLLEAAAFDQGDLQVIGNSVYEPLAADATPVVPQSYWIVEPFEVSHEWVRPVRVKPFDVLRSIMVALAWGW